MTTPFSNDVVLAVVPGGQVTLTVTFETFLASGTLQPVTGTQLVVTPEPAGAAVLTTTTGFTTPDNATWSYTWRPGTGITPGDYTVAWTANAQGSGSPLAVSYNLVVAALPEESPSPGVYATVQQYQAWSGDAFTPADQVTTFIRRAGEVIDLALKAAVYPTDVNGMPTEPSTIDAFMRATCAQTEFMIAVNDRTGVKGMYQSTSMGGVSLTRAPIAIMGPLPKLAPQAAAILETAGVLPSAVLVGW